VTARGCRGFTTVEALISFAILLIILTGVLDVYARSRQIFARGERKADIQQNARFALSQIAREVRMAGYFPENLTDPPASPPLADPIRVATDAALVIYGDTRGGGVSEAVMFCLDGDTVRRTHAAVDAAAAFTCTAGEVLAEGVVDLRFIYYDATGTPIPDPPAAPFVLDGQGPGAVPDMTTATARRAVRRVLVTVTTRGYAPGVPPQDFTLISDVEMRNVD
jgi:type II secretory pathway pseudopilin PulG